MAVVSRAEEGEWEELENAGKADLKPDHLMRPPARLNTVI